MIRSMLLVVGLLGLASCNKADSGDCRKAVMRIRELTGTSNIQGGGDIEAAVRSCRGNATRESVRCAMEAATLDELERCKLLSKEEIEAIKEDQRLEDQRKQALEKRKQANAAADAAVAPAVIVDAGAADAGTATDAGSGTGTGTGTAAVPAAGTAAK